MVSVWPEKRHRKGIDVWRVIWRRPDGKREYQDVGTSIRLRDAVLQKKREELYALEAGIPLQRHDRTTDEAFKTYLDHSKAHKSWRTYRNWDKPYVEKFQEFIGQRLLASVTTQDILDWESDLVKKGHDPNGIIIALKVVRTAFNYFRREGWITKGPSFHYPQEEEVGRVIPGPELAVIFAAVSPAHQEAYAILLATGIRLGELLALTGQDVKFNPADGLWSIEVKTLKRRRTDPDRFRRVPIRAAWAEEFRKRPGKIVTLSRDSLQHTLQTVTDADHLNLGRTRCHDFRHTWATRYMEKFGDLPGLMIYGGWKDLKSVAKYQHLTRARNRAVLEVEFGFAPHLPLPPTQNR